MHLIETFDIPISISTGFLQEFVEVGTRYPPPSNLLFGLLVGLSFTMANILWNILIAFGILFSVLMINKATEKNGLSVSYLFSFTLLLILESSRSTIYFEQLNFFLLICLLLFFIHSEKPIAGFWLGLAVLFKPFVVVCALYFLIQKLWKGLAVMIATGVTSLLISFPIIGIGPIMQFFSGSFTNKVAELYLDPICQSIYSIFMKLNLYSEYQYDTVLTAGLILFVFLVTTISLYLVFYRSKKDPVLLIPLLVSFSLLIFPKVNSHYSVVLILPLFVL